MYLINKKVNDIQDQIDLKAESMKNEIDVARLKLLQKLKFKIDQFNKNKTFCFYQNLLNNFKSDRYDYQKAKITVS